MAPQTGLLVGVDSFVQKPVMSSENRIPVRIRIDTAKLPDLDVHVLRDRDWQSLPRSQVGSTEPCVYWPGVLPTFAIRDLRVTSEEHRVRLASMARLAANIAVPEIEVSNNPADHEKEFTLPAVSLPETPASIVNSAAEDSIRGAITMAVWAVPRIDPWMDVLVASLTLDAKKLTTAVKAVDASWWRFPPWAQSAQSDLRSKTTSTGAQERLWLAAIQAFEIHKCLRPSEIAEQITKIFLRGNDCPDERLLIQDWLRTTQKVLRADTSISHGNWTSMPVGLAIQMVLARPEPARFRTWLCDEEISLPPSVAWSAAALCGLFHGFRKLDTSFRGPPLQQEVLAIQALRMCSESTVSHWPDMTEDEATWRREFDKFVLSWAGREFVTKRQKERGRWFMSDFRDPAVKRDAVAVAKRFNWPCVSRIVRLDSGHRTWDGPGSLQSMDKKLNVTGSIRLRLSPDDLVEQEVDHRSFLKMVTIKPGRLPAPPRSAIQVKSIDKIPGFKMLPDIISEAEEERIISEIDHSEWSSELQRRVQHYGWRYDYKLKQVDSTMRIGKLPEWAEMMAQRLFKSGYLLEIPDQVIVNEYVRDQGISPHIDNPSSFADGIATISLLETWEMDFRKRGSKVKVTQRLERRSATILTGDARYQWTHGISKRKTEPASQLHNDKKARVPRGRRVSLTFRKVIRRGVQPH